ncbi:hypothetical protein I4U23_005624 [Adineta vaga]|nr:hypothetical protein I4U23_005624 [Adineta vaga]
MATSLSSVEQYVPSYFVKTTVLWMCETIDLDHIYTLMMADDSREEKFLADRLAKRWIEYVCPILESTICPHYFIKDLNILDGYSKQYLDELAFILQNNVDLDDEHVPCSQLKTSNHNDEMMEHQNQLEKITIELIDQPDFIQDCITLCADMSLDENFIKMLVSEDDDNSDSDTDDEDAYIGISAVSQGFLLLLLMALYDDSNRNNWQL